MTRVFLNKMWKIIDNWYKSFYYNHRRFQRSAVDWWKKKVAKGCDKHGKLKLLSDPAPEQSNLTCPIRSYWNSGLRSKPSRWVHRQSCQSWYNFPPPSIFLVSLQLSRNNSTGNAYYVGYRILKRSSPGGRCILKKICYQEAPPCRKGIHFDCFLLTIGISFTYLVV